MKAATMRNVVMNSLTYKMILPIEFILPDGFPCIRCLVYANCSSPCDRLEMDKDRLNYLLTDLRVCPDCGGKTILNLVFLSSSSTVGCRNCGHKFTKIWDENYAYEWVRDYENKS